MKVDYYALCAIAYEEDLCRLRSSGMTKDEILNAMEMLDLNEYEAIYTKRSQFMESEGQYVAQDMEYYLIRDFDGAYMLYRKLSQARFEELDELNYGRLSELLYSIV